MRVYRISDVPATAVYGCMAATYAFRETGVPPRAAVRPGDGGLAVLNLIILK